MLFGVKNGRPTYVRAITKAFHEYIDVFMKIFLYDFIVFNHLSTRIEKLKKCFLKCRESLALVSIQINVHSWFALELFWDL
jgi:hypothetical protein